MVREKGSHYACFRSSPTRPWSAPTSRPRTRPGSTSRRSRPRSWPAARRRLHHARARRPLQPEDLAGILAEKGRVHVRHAGQLRRGGPPPRHPGGPDPGRLRPVSATRGHPRRHPGRPPPPRPPPAPRIGISPAHRRYMLSFLLPPRPLGPRPGADRRVGGRPAGVPPPLRLRRRRAVARPRRRARDRPPVEIIGMADQQYLIRKGRPAGEPKHASARRKLRDRESQRWLDSGDRIGPAPGGDDVRWVRVADREADIYEYLGGCREIGHGFVVRVMQDRVVLDPETGRRGGVTRGPRPPSGGRRRGPQRCAAATGHRARRARPASTAQGDPAPGPRASGGAWRTNPPIDCGFVRAWEAGDTRGGRAPGMAALPRDRPVEGPQRGALGVLRDYSLRPVDRGVPQGPEETGPRCRAPATGDRRPGCSRRRRS